MKSLLEVLLSKVFARQVLNVAAIKHKQTCFVTKKIILGFSNFLLRLSNELSF